MEEPTAELPPPPPSRSVAPVEPSASEPVAEEPPVAEEQVAAEPERQPEPEPEPEPQPEPVAEAPERARAETAAIREGGGIDQAEMRRRIEETRARLKAKAFDAMMSGEAALLARDSGDKPVPKSEDHGLDPETDTVIDDSLSQEDY